MSVQNGYPQYYYKLSEMNMLPFNKVYWLFDELSVTQSSLSTSHRSATYVTFQCDHAFYYKNVQKYTVRLLQNYPSPLFEFFTSFAALVTFSDSCTT